MHIHSRSIFILFLSLLYKAAALLLYFDDGFECFRCFANLLNSHFFFALYRLERDKLDVHVAVFEAFFKQKLPVLFAHFAKIEVASDMYYLEWSLTLFVKFVPLNICARVWDSYLLLGEAFFIRAALGAWVGLFACLLMGRETERERGRP
jgi:hypothetical protein